MHKVSFGSLARMMSESDQVVDLQWREMAKSKWPNSRTHMRNVLGSLTKMIVGENVQLVDLPLGELVRSKWPSTGPPMHNILGTLARIMGKNL